MVDPLNLIDMLVVAFDIMLMVAGDGSEGDVGGLIKGLRGARGFRLLRLLRTMRAMKNFKQPAKLVSVVVVRNKKVATANPNQS